MMWSKLLARTSRENYGEFNMSDYENQSTGVDAADIRALLAASFQEEQEPASAMLARAMIYAQDADHKLRAAQNVRAEAEKYRAEMQRVTMEETEALVQQMHDDAEQEHETALKLREEAEDIWDSARAELERATSLRQESEQLRIQALADAEEYRRATLAEAEREAINIKDAARAQVNAELAERQEHVDQEIRNALASIEKMQEAAKAELDAQQMYTEALRFRAASPGQDEPVEKPKPRARKPRKS